VVTAPPTLRVVPERSLEAADLEAYGRDTVRELIADLAAEDGDDADDPAFLINGKRVPGLDSVANLPAEAIVKIDILPAGAGVKVGATSRQRVYDIQLRRELDLAAANAATRLATEGRWSSRRGDVVYSHIRGERRINVTAKLRDDAMLLESERSVVQPIGSVPGAGRFRSLSPTGDRADLSVAAADSLATWLSASFNANLSLSHRRALLGPFAPAGLAEAALGQRARTAFASADLTLNAQRGSWQIGLFGSYVRQSGRTATDRVVAGALDPAVATTRSIARSLGARASAIGPIVHLPAGPVMLNLGAGGSRDTIDGRTDSQGPVFRTMTTLTSTSLTAAIDVPIASRSAGVLAGIGDLSAAVELGRQHSSDFGGFGNYTFSLLWRPDARLSLTASLGRSDSAPPVASLDEPRIETPGIRYFDPLRGETVDVTRIDGGTFGLRRQSDRSRRLAAHLTPFRALGLRLNAEYLETRNLNLVSELPLASLSVVQAFPERFIRDASGRLAVVDARPVSIARRAERQVRAGFILSLPLGASRPGRDALAGDDEASEARPRPTGTSVRPRLQVSATYSRLLGSELTIRAGQRPIDLLSAGAVGFGGLGQPRNRFDASLTYAERGLGVRASLQARGASLVEASGSTANVLRFHPLTTFSLGAWVQGQRLAPGSRWMKGTRLTLSLLNASGVRERVDDRFGATPLGYQRAYRDPIGRSIEIQLRKKF
jgi:hypothetical protein